MTTTAATTVNRYIHLISRCKFSGVLLLIIFNTIIPASQASDAKSTVGRSIISLDGTWQIAEGNMTYIPASFSHEIQVPGLVSLAVPGFDNAGPMVTNRYGLGQKDPKRDAFWYRRMIHIDGLIPAVAMLKVNKAMFGTRVIVNGEVVGDHLPCFTPGYFNVHDHLKPGDNELIIRVGADRNAVQGKAADGFDFEKTRYIPGIYDSVSLILSGAPNILNAQIVPDLTNKVVRVRYWIQNSGADSLARVHFVVSESKSGRVVSQLNSLPFQIFHGACQTQDVEIPMPHGHLWTPEDPFLYKLVIDAGSDQFATRFGMRTFSFDPVTHKATLNGKPYFMRGSNFTLYRFFEDAGCGNLPWDLAWVRLLHQRMKEMHWNCLRYCIGFPPEKWYDIADEEGILIEDQFPIWYGGTGWCEWPDGLTSQELAAEYGEWLSERWNHPCLAIWDACNETTSSNVTAAVQTVRGMDLQHLPWEYSYCKPRTPGDVLVLHPYHFCDPDYKLSDLGHEPAIPQGSEITNNDDLPVIINEYAYLWLNRDGTPTTLTRKLYEKKLGTNSTTEQRRYLYARYLAAETEFWRENRKAAAVMHFAALAYSRKDGQTSDHWLDVGKLTWEPDFFKYVRDAFAPIGIAIDSWADTYGAGVRYQFPIIVINDRDRDWRGKMELCFSNSVQKVVFDHVENVFVPAYNTTNIMVTVKMPDASGAYQAMATLKKTPDGNITSIRDFYVSPKRDAASMLASPAGRN